MTKRDGSWAGQVQRMIPPHPQLYKILVAIPYHHSLQEKFQTHPRPSVYVFNSSPASYPLHTRNFPPDNPKQSLSFTIVE